MRAAAGGPPRGGGPAGPRAELTRLFAANRGDDDACGGPVLWEAEALDRFARLMGTQAQLAASRRRTAGGSPLDRTPGQWDADSAAPSPVRPGGRSLGGLEASSPPDLSPPPAITEKQQLMNRIKFKTQMVGAISWTVSAMRDAEESMTKLEAAAAPLDADQDLPTNMAHADVTALAADARDGWAQQYAEHGVLYAAFTPMILHQMLLERLEQALAQRRNFNAEYRVASDRGDSRPSTATDEPRELRRGSGESLANEIRALEDAAPLEALPWRPVPQRRPSEGRSASFPGGGNPGPVPQRRRPGEPSSDDLEPCAFSLAGSLFFVDISGFTMLSARMSADELKYHCNAYFGMLLGVIARHGGDVIKFLGDAFFVLWPCDANASEAVRAANAWRAARCAVDVMRRCGEYDTGDGDTAVQLRLHGGLAAGTVQVFVVGAQDRWEVVIAGAPIRQLAETEGEASKGQVILSPQMRDLLLLPQRAGSLADCPAGTEKERLSKFPVPLKPTPLGNFELKWDARCGDDDDAALRGSQNEISRRRSSGMTDARPCDVIDDLFSIGMVKSSVRGLGAIGKPVHFKDTSQHGSLDSSQHGESHDRAPPRPLVHVHGDREVFDAEDCNAARGALGALAKYAFWALDPASIGGTPEDADAIAKSNAKRSQFGKKVRPGARLLRTFVPEAARSALDGGQPGMLGSMRTVVTVFVDVLGLDAALAEGDVVAVQGAYECAVGAFRAQEGMLRQFAVDDKGVVFIGVFGVPHHAHEDDAARAVRAAGALLRALAQRGVAARAGVALGRVYCGLVGNAARSEYAVLGGSVNLAARLMSHAPRDTILVDRGVRDATEKSQNSRGGRRAARCGAVVSTFAARGTVAAKGYPEPVFVWEAAFKDDAAQRPVQRPGLRASFGSMRAGDFSEQFDLTVTVGRAAETRAVAAVVAELAQRSALGVLDEGSECGAAVATPGATLIVGPRGSGKSHVLKHARLLAGETHADAAPGLAPRVVEVVASAMSAFVGVLEALCENDVGADARSAPAVRRRRALRNLLQQTSPPEALDGHVDGILAYVETGVEVAPVASLVAEALCAVEAPTLIVVDDAHRLTLFGWHVVAHVAKRRPEKVRMVLGLRPMRDADGAVRAALSGLARSDVVIHDLGPLDAPACADLALAVFKRTSTIQQRAFLARKAAATEARALGATLLARSRGVPQRVVQMVASLVEVVRGREWTFADFCDDLGSVEDPDAQTRRTIVVRLDLLRPAQQGVLQVASVLGAGFNFGQLRHLYSAQVREASTSQVAYKFESTADRVATTVRNALADLINANFFRKIGADYEFVHEAVVATVYELIPVVTRQRLHIFAAQWHAANSDAADPQLAQHLLNAGEPATEALMAVAAGAILATSTLRDAKLAYSLLVAQQLLLLRKAPSGARRRAGPGVRRDVAELLLKRPDEASRFGGADLGLAHFEPRDGATATVGLWLVVLACLERQLAGAPDAKRAPHAARNTAAAALVVLRATRRRWPFSASKGVAAPKDVEQQLQRMRSRRGGDASTLAERRAETLEAHACALAHAARVAAAEAVESALPPTPKKAKASIFNYMTRATSNSTAPVHPNSIPSSPSTPGTMWPLQSSGTMPDEERNSLNPSDVPQMFPS